MWEAVAASRFMIDIMNKFYQLLFFCAFVCFAHGICAQTFKDYKRQAKQEFEAYREKTRRDFSAYRDSVNAEFARFMREAWKKRDAKPAVPLPERPEPPKPVVKHPGREPSQDTLPFELMDPSLPFRPKLQPVTPRPQPFVPLDVPEPDVPELKPVQPAFPVDFYGGSYALPLTDAQRFELKGVDENSVADAWLRLSEADYLPLLSACMQWRDSLLLCDWGYVRFLEKMTGAFFPESRQNEARLLQMFILTQSGYKVRIARSGNRLCLLLPLREMVYGYPYIMRDGMRYYILPSDGKGPYYVMEHAFPKEQQFSMEIPVMPSLASALTARRQLCSKVYPEVTMTVAVNKNLMDFYTDYPQTSWNVYVQASLSTEAKAAMYPALKAAVAGKDKSVAAGMLLNFVQTAFAYRTDDEQFGYERPLFPDETLYYPYSDCEDRAILYTVLVRELLGLDVVLLHYPNHLATAVALGNDVPGDYLTVDGRKYLVCDPTYINAGIGEAMSQYKQTKAEVIRVAGK